MLSHGCVLGWFPPVLLLLVSDETPLITGPLTTEQLSWLGSVNCIGGLFGSFTFGFFTSLMGCKRAMLFLTLPSISFWLLVYFGTSYYYILFARFFVGWTGAGIQSTVVLFVAEIADNK